MFTCLDDRLLSCLHALTITHPFSCVPSCSFVWMLWWLHAHMHVYYYAHMFLHAWLVTWIRGRLYSPMLTLGCTFYWLLTCLNTYMLTCFDDLILLSSHSFLIICYYAACFDDNMLLCTHTLIFTCLTSTHMHTLGWLMICLHVWQLKWSWSCTFVHSSALTSVFLCKGNWAVRGMCIWVFQCSYAFCSHACILPLTCLYTLMLKCSHVQLSVTIS